MVSKQKQRPDVRPPGRARQNPTEYLHQEGQAVPLVSTGLLPPPRGSPQPPPLGRAASGSVVGFPSLSRAQPSGILVPWVRASSIFPTAAALVAMSSSMWSPSSPGEARDSGRVENREVALRVGATYGLPLVKAWKYKLLIEKQRKNP